jgi:hypothetical protein
MRHLSITVTAALAAITAQVVLAQTSQPRMKPAVPGAPGDPAWQGILRMSDGRTFVTDGALALDAALAKPAKLPERALATKVLENYLNASHKDEFGFSDLSAAASGKTFTAPSGVALSATYVDYLRRTLPARSVRFRMTGGRDPVVVLVSGTAVGVLMPVATAQ